MRTASSPYSTAAGGARDDDDACVVIHYGSIGATHTIGIIVTHIEVYGPFTP